jgi:hypothetical protein
MDVKILIQILQSEQKRWIELDKELKKEQERSGPPGINFERSDKQ